MDQGDWRLVDSDRNSQAGLRTDMNRSDTDWVEGYLEEWWDNLLWVQMADRDSLLSWWLRDGVTVLPISAQHPTQARTIRTQPVYRSWNKADFTLSYPTLAPYAPVASAGAYGYDPWAGQMHYSVWW